MSAAHAILLVADPLATTGPQATGEAEQVLSLLDREIVRCGRRSMVVARRGSRAAGELIELAEATPQAAGEAVATACAERGVDLVHIHGADFAEYLPPPRIPTLVTLHLPLSSYPTRAVRPERLRTFLCGVSNAQLAGHPAAKRLLGAVPNGVDVELMRPLEGRRTHVAAIGALSAQAGLAETLGAARRARVPLLLATPAPSGPDEEATFEAEIRRRLDHHRRWVGPLEPDGRRRLLGRARCLVEASRIPVASSLAAMEALACGTPVVARRAGALADIVEDGRTGFLVDGADELARAIARCAEIDPVRCRAAAEARFSAERMARQYLAIYDRLMI
jgi:glycosyltransferase involved in cell wall biosynthesis